MPAFSHDSTIFILMIGVSQFYGSLCGINAFTSLNIGLDAFLKYQKSKNDKKQGESKGIEDMRAQSLALLLDNCP